MAALVVAACQGRAGLDSWWRRLRYVAGSPVWYALAVLVPLAVHLVIVLVNHGLGAPLPTPAQLGHWPDLPATFVVNLDRDRDRRGGRLDGLRRTAAAAPSRSAASLGDPVSALRILWHLPLMITGDSSVVMGVVGNAAFQLILLQLFSSSGGRWSLAAVWHATLNTFGGSFFTAMVTGADQERYGLLLSALYAVLAIMAVLVGRHHATRRDQWVSQPAAPTPVPAAPL